VSFNDILRFLARLNQLRQGLNLKLPSEAQWEYACRAGTETATYAGQMEILGQHNAPILDKIAWYGGNSGLGFELSNGQDSSAWPKKQYPHTRAGTRRVREKEPNGWGLYDTLGNVWEWCEDHRHDSYVDAPTDGAAWVVRGRTGRVVRGGSWNADARSVRAAYRRWLGPDDRYGTLGFRCAQSIT